MGAGLEPWAWPFQPDPIRLGHRAEVAWRRSDVHVAWRPPDVDVDKNCTRAPRVADACDVRAAALTAVHARRIWQEPADAHQQPAAATASRLRLAPRHAEDALRQGRAVRGRPAARARASRSPRGAH
eukprot:314045-Prymnesium_polylepis.1